MNNHSGYHKDITCEICDITFKDPLQYKKHVEETHSSKPCLLCKKSIQPESFELHLKENHFCWFCNAKNLKNSLEHFESHKIAEERECKYCDVVLSKNLGSIWTL